MLTLLLEHLYDWLSPSEPIRPADAVFALAGRESRKRFALELLHCAPAPTLVLSVGRFEIRRFAQLPWPGVINLLEVASRTPPPLRHYFVSFEGGDTQVELIPRGRLGTLTEIRALVRWLERRPQIASLLVISSAPHLRRVRACCRALLPAGLPIHFIAVPNDAPLGRATWWHERRARRVVVKEIPKLFVYKLLLWGARLRSFLD